MLASCSWTMASPFGATEEATWKFLVSRMGLTAGLGHPEEPATLSDSSMLAGLFPHLLYWNHAGAYEKKKAVAANRMKLSFLDRISLPNDFKIALVLFFFFKYTLI